MDRLWLRHYPKTVPKEIKCDEYSSLTDFLEKKTQEFADRPAFSNMGSTLSYRDFEEKTRAFANYLHQDLKLNKGERIVIILPNLLQTPIVIFGALRAGLIVVNTNPLYTPTELKRQLDDSGASVVVVLENFASVLAKTLPQKHLKSIIITRMGDLLSLPKALVINTVVKHVKKLVPAFDIPESISFKKVLRIGAKYEFEPVKADIDDVAFLQYTGGTTGISKGAMLTHRNMLANIEQATTWVVNGLSGEKKLEKGCEIVVTPLPLYHIFALLANCMTFIGLGGMNYLITNPRDLPGFVKELKKIRFTAMSGVNTLFNGLLNTPGFDTLDFSSLKFVIGGGMAIQKNIAEDWQKVTGCFLTEAYGLTETSPAVCINPLYLKEFKGSIGLPLPSTECTVHSDEGEQLPIGVIGELYIRGPQVMKGYWNSPKETAKVMTDDGRLRTGDIARIDEEGYVYIVDRKKDMILVSGFNVYPNEVEGVVAAHPDVFECGAVGVPDLKSGEVVKIFVVKKNAALDEDTLVQYCREHLSAYKVPRHVEFRNELPKTQIGKILRRALKETELIQ